MFFKKDYGFDLGTSYMHICSKEDGLILNEPAAIATEHPSKRIVAVGENAYEMYERAPSAIQISMPVKYGVVADFDHMLSILDIQCKNLKVGKGSRPCAVVCVPFHISEVERRALYDLFVRSKSHFKDIYMLEKPLAAGLGCHIDVLQPEGNIIVDIGGGTTEISVISLGGVVISDLVKIGGEKFDQNIRNYVKKEYNVHIGLKTAERIKIKIADAMPGNSDFSTFEVIGRDVVSGLPKNITITSKDVHLAIKDDMMVIIDAIKLLLEKTPPELSSDILLAGLHVTGGTAGIRNIGALISKETGLNVIVNDQPNQCVINGIHHILNHFNKHRSILFTLK